MPDRRPDYSHDTLPQPRELVEGMEIDPERSRKWAGLIGYLIFFLCVAGAFVWLFVQLTLSWQIAAGSVSFLLGYMLLMAWWATRDGLHKDNRMS